MDALALVADIEAHYALVLALTAEQEARLRAGDLDDLPALLLAKAEEVDRANALVASLREAPGSQDPDAYRAAMGQLGATMARVVAAEERCRALSPAAPPAAPRARAAAAYRRP